MKVHSPDPSLASRLQQARHRLFVGRVAELTSWRCALQSEQWPVPLWHVYGLGGIGKTSLLREWKHLSLERGVPVAAIDARDSEPTPASFCAALRDALSETLGESLGLSPQTPATPAALFEAVGGVESRVVLQIDTCELLAPLDHWLRDTLLPTMPANLAVVMAGREPLSLAWRADAGWQEMVRFIALDGLSASEGDDYLQRRGIAEGARPAVLGWTHGHPLALSLAADVWLQGSSAPEAPPDPFALSGGEVFQPGDLPQLVGPLLEHLVREVPGPGHRAALQACAVVSVMTEALLCEMLGEGATDVHELFEWLRGLSLMQSSRFGLFPHDVAREVLSADLRWRNSALHGELHGRARKYYQRRIHQLPESEQQRAIFDYIFLHRLSPSVSRYLRWDDDHHRLDAAREEELEDLLALVERHEGAVSRQIAARWFEAQPEGLLVVRDAGGAIQGFVFQLALQRAAAADIEADPAARALWDYLAAQAPLREDEAATLFRFWMDKDGYQDVGATQSLIFVQAVRHYITTPHLAFTVFPCATPDFWHDGFRYADQQRLPALDFRVGERTFGSFGHDWRARPLLAWFDLLSQREMHPVTSAAPSAPSTVPHATFGVLGEEAFYAAVRLGLRHWSEPATLRHNALLETSLVHRRARQIGAAKTGEAAPNLGPTLDERVFALRLLLREAVAALALVPRQERAYRALELVYGRRALSQEAATGVMNVSHSSFRRYLRAALAFVAKSLWHREVVADMVNESIFPPQSGENEHNLTLF